MKTATVFAVFTLLVVAVACASQPLDAPNAPSVEPVVDTLDQGVVDSAPQDDLGDLNSLDSDLAAFQ